MIETIFSQFDKILPVLALISFSILLRLALQSFGQRWIMTTAHTSTLVILPLITYVITNVISGNIALSLGMVGALSIVRFRNPVRSPLELSVYFGSITMGIAASVSLMWLIFLVASVLLGAFLLAITSAIYRKICKEPFFTTSFSEGNSLSTISISADCDLKYLNENNSLTVKQVSSNSYEYIMSASNFEEILILEKLVKNNKNVIKYQLNR
jgi:hypothetical protein